MLMSKEIKQIDSINNKSSGFLQLGAIPKL